ncbi:MULTISPECIES: hypothetical protein [unclassified Bosea (in: a-proteobacteria)]|uniref:hypothetical protein n=1 Tax=unclassified Bosea (in: a-proteobacteria) TaxID=2653178 RepID=UPI00125F9EE3|nr:MULTISPECIES: hypothetical protein [unclassified Bosea (in: a-proteobacteria)]
MKTLSCIASILYGLGGVARAESTFFEIGGDAQFASYRDIVRRYVLEKSKAKRSEICVIGFVAGDNSRAAWVIWRAARQVILLEPGSDDLTFSRRVIDLRKDVVADEQALKGSTYRVTRKWVADLTGDCEARGQRMTIQR